MLKFTAPPIPSRCEQPSRVAYVLDPGALLTCGVEAPIKAVHEPCIHNELAAARNRVCAEHDEIDDACLEQEDKLHTGCCFSRRAGRKKCPLTREACAAMERMHKRYLHNKKEIPQLTPAHPVDIVAGYMGTKKNTMNLAYHSLLVHDLNRADSKGSMFVKVEHVEYDKGLGGAYINYHPESHDYRRTTNKDPRGIQFRSRRYVAALACFLKPFEEAWYHKPGNGPTRTRQVAKGLNPRQRAMLLRKKAAAFRDPVYLLLDHSRFDSFVYEWLLKHEHKHYLHAYRGNPEALKILKQLLKQQIINRLRSRHGVKYKLRGTRLSGDFNTGLGNTVINEEMFESILADWGIELFELLLDGDDSVIIIEREDLHKVDMSLFKYYHMKTKLNVVDRFEDVEFCQCKPVEVEPGQWTMARNPVRFLQHFTTQRNDNGPEKWSTVAGYALCEFVANNGVPVLSVLCAEVYKHLEKRQINFKHSGLSKQMLRPLQYEHRIISITPEARASFAKAWGIEVPQQIALETMFKNDMANVLMGNTQHRQVKIKPDKPITRELCTLSFIDLSYKEAPTKVDRVSEHVAKWRSELLKIAKQI